MEGGEAYPPQPGEQYSTEIHSSFTKMFALVMSWPKTLFSLMAGRLLNSPKRSLLMM